MPLATALITSGIVGGPGAVPFAALMYFVKKPLMAAAGGAFDMAFGKQQPQPQAQPQPSMQPQLAMAGECLSFQDFYLLDEGFGDWAGQKLGSMAGTVAGKTVGLTKRVSSILAKSWSGLIQFASQNKLAIARAAFLMGCGALLGAGIGKLTHDGIDAVTQALGDRGVPAAELNWLRHNFKLGDIEMDKDGIAHSNAEGLFAKGGHYQRGDASTNWQMSGQELDQSDSTISNALDKLKHTFSSVFRKDALSGPGGSTAGMQYQLNILPKPGQSAQDILQGAYRDLAKQLHGSGVNILDLKATGEDPSGAIKAMLSVAPNLTAPGAIGGAIGMATPRQNTVQQQPTV